MSAQPGNSESILAQWLRLWRALNRRIWGQSEEGETSGGPDLKGQMSAKGEDPRDFGLMPQSDDQIDDQLIKEERALLRDLHEAYLQAEKAEPKRSRGPNQKSAPERASSLPGPEAVQAQLAALAPKSIYNMLLFVMYDIENNRVRKKVADYLEAKGLKRIQKSVFFGELERKHYALLRETLLEIQASYENKDSLMLVPIAEDEFKKLYLIGKEVDFSLDLMRGSTLFI